MAIKGLKEALAKKRAQHDPGNQDNTDADVKVKPVQPTRSGSKPQKRAAGRGR